MTTLTKSILCCLAALTLSVSAQTVPPQINYQGKLTDALGKDLGPADFALGFNVYDVEQGGTPIWGSQEIPGVPVVNGYFNVILGADTQQRSIASAFNTSPRWLEISVAGKAVSPRQKILSAPFALNSGQLSGREWADFFGSNDPATAKLPGSRIADGAISDSQVSTLSHLSASDGGPGRALMVDAEGRVGIGTIVPQNKLEVYDYKLNDHGLAALINQEYENTDSGQDFVKGLEILKNKYNIPVGVAAKGYQIGIALQSYVADPNFKGSIESQYAIWARTGLNQVGDTGARTINNAYGIYIEGLTHPDGTIKNHYGVYQTGSGTKNYFAGKVGIGTEAPQATLDVVGTMQLSGGEAWTDSSWAVRIKSPISSVWRTTTKDNLGKYLGFGMTDTGWYFLTSTASDTSAPVESPFVIRNTGNVGIGTVSPLDRLHIKQGADEPTGIRWERANYAPYRIGNIGPGFVVHNLADNVYELIFDGSGKVGIARDPTANRFEVEGNASKTVAGSWFANSDRRIKQDVKTVGRALETIDRVRLVSFNYTDEYRQHHPSIESHRYLNVIAQEFRDVFPENVSSSGEKLANGDEILQVDTYPLTIYSAAAVQELHKIVKEQARELSTKEQRINSLEQRLNQIEHLLSRTQNQIEETDAKSK